MEWSLCISLLRNWTSYLQVSPNKKTITSLPNTNRCHLMTFFYSMPGTVTPHNLILLTTWYSRYYNSHCTDEEIEVQRSPSEWVVEWGLEPRSNPNAFCLHHIMLSLYFCKWGNQSPEPRYSGLSLGSYSLFSAQMKIQHTLGGTCLYRDWPELCS